MVRFREAASPSPQYESELQETKNALGEVHLKIYALKEFRRLLDEDESS